MEFNIKTTHELFGYWLLEFASNLVNEYLPDVGGGAEKHSEYNVRRNRPVTPIVFRAGIAYPMGYRGERGIGGIHDVLLELIARELRPGIVSITMTAQPDGKPLFDALKMEIEKAFSDAAPTLNEAKPELAAPAPDQAGESLSIYDGLPIPTGDLWSKADWRAIFQHFADQNAVPYLPVLTRLLLERSSKQTLKYGYVKRKSGEYGRGELD